MQKTASTMAHLGKRIGLMSFRDFFRKYSTLPKGPPLHDHLKNVSWLLGKWRSEMGVGKYPTIKDFKFGEELEFSHVGQPSLQFVSYSWNPDSELPLHRELGFLRVHPENHNKVSLLFAENLGVTEVQEGVVKGQELIVESHTVGRMSFGKSPAVKKVKRKFTRTGDTLEKVVEMETENTAMSEHVRIKYVKVA